MDEKLQELLNELYKELGGDVNVNTNTTQQQVPTTNQAQQVVEQTQSEEPADNQSEEYDYQTQLGWENWKQYGRTAFISMKGHPRVLKYMPLIEQRAEYKLQMDLAKNQVKDRYLYYLLEAYNEIQAELAEIMKDFLQSHQTPVYGYMGMHGTQETPAYTMKDYYRDYKKALEYATIKGMGEIYYKDSSEKGKYGDPKLRLGETLDEFNI
jgi:hypothetical protein